MQDIKLPFTLNIRTYVSLAQKISDDGLAVALCTLVQSSLSLRMNYFVHSSKLSNREMRSVVSYCKEGFLVLFDLAVGKRKGEGKKRAPQFHLAA